MATFTAPAPASRPRVPFRYGGTPPGGGDAGADSGDLFEARLRRARLGIIVAFVGIVMIFISLTSAYIVRQGLPTYDPRTNGLVHDWIPVRLPMLLLTNTFVLLLSSATMELARRQAGRQLALADVLSIEGEPAPGSGQISWLTVTIVLGMSFLVGQLMVWRQLEAIGFYIATSPSSSFVYLLTGVHGVHLLGGVVALLVAGVAALLRRSAESQYVLVDVTGWYWHFMAALWLYIFCLLEFAR